MNDPIKLNDSFACSVERNREIEEPFKPQGTFLVELFDKDGKLKVSHEIPNTVVNQGKNHALDAIFNSATQIAAWYMGLIDNSGFSTNPVTDTASSHAGWVEFQGYTEATRPEWTAGPAASQSVTNSASVNFTINTSGNVRGAFIISDNVKGGVSGTLWATGLFTASTAVANGDVLKITYTVNS